MSKGLVIISVGCVVLFYPDSWLKSALADERQQGLWRVVSGLVYLAVDTITG